MTTLRLYPNADAALADGRGLKAIWTDGSRIAYSDRDDLPSGNWYEISYRELAEMGDETSEGSRKPAKTPVFVSLGGAVYAAEEGR